MIARSGGAERTNEDRDQCLINGRPPAIAKKGDRFLGDTEFLGKSLIGPYAQIFAGLVEGGIDHGDEFIFGKHSAPIRNENITYLYVITDR